MTTICSVCRKVLHGSGQPISHGFCPTCAILWRARAGVPQPALMAPAATRIDCYYCQHVDLDRDGVPDGCDLPIGEKCIAPGKRGPWL